MSNTESSVLLPLLAGAMAGTTTDIALYPLDTIKTRLQSPVGFIKAGGFNKVYKGIGAAALGSAPGAALFFMGYEATKHRLLTNYPEVPVPAAHMLAASMGEVLACLIRVPTEAVKQRMQANTGAFNSFGSTIKHVAKTRGLLGFYEGYGITLFREIPFSAIQFPLYEGLKTFYRNTFNGQEPKSYESAAFGSVSGAVSAAATTPIDVLKTRIILGEDANGAKYNGIRDCTKRLLQGE